MKVSSRKVIMKYYDFDEVQKNAKQNKGFVFGEHEAGRKQFELGVKGKGKSRKERLALGEVTRLNLLNEKEEVIIVDPERDAFKD